MSQGWIKLHRKMLDSSLWFHPTAFPVFMYLLLKANHCEKKFPWNGSDISVPAGSLISSHDSIRIGLKAKLTLKQIRTALEYLKETGRVAVQTNNRYSMISICKWEEYQAEGSPEGNLRADVGQTEGNLRATNKNDKELKNDKENTPLPPEGKRKRVKVEKYRELREADFEHRWPNQWREGGKTAMAEWITYKAKAGHPAILESYLRQMKRFETQPKLFSDYVYRAIEKGWQGLNEEIPLGVKPNPITAAADAKVANRPPPKPFEPPPSINKERTPEELERNRQRVAALLSGAAK